MIHFVLVAGRVGSTFHLGDRLARALRSTTLLGGELITAASPSGTWRLAAIADPDPFLDPRVHVDGEGVVVTNGCPVERGGPLSLEQVLHRFGQGGAEAARDRVLGTFNLLCVSPDRGLAVTGDVAGCYPVYHGRTADTLVISNRSTTVAHVLGTTGWNLRSLGWLVGMSLVAGDEVPAPGVQVLPPGRIGRMRWGDTTLAVEDGPHPALAAAGGQPGRHELSSDEWDQVTDDLIAEVQALGHLGSPLALPITGGKDSRLVLALAKAGGLTDLRTSTTGAPDDPEVICAARVAAVAGYEHVLELPPEVLRPSSRLQVRGPGPQPPLDGRAWHRAARAHGRYEGIVSAWAGFKTPVTPAAVIIKGWGGEHYRWRSRMVPCVDRFLDGQVPVTNGATVLADLYQERVDPLRLLVPRERARQIAWYRQRVHERAGQLRLDLVPDDFWLSHKAAQYQGPTLQDVPRRVVANPLVSTSALRHYAQLSLGVRRTERLHYEVMRRAAPELVGLPFFEQAWAPEIRALDPDTMADQPFLAPVRLRGAGLVAEGQSRTRSWVTGQRGWARVRRGERRTRVHLLGPTRLSRALPAGNEPVWALLAGDPAPVVAMVREAADAGLSSICQVDRVCRLVESRPRLTRREELQLADAVSVALLLLGRVERVVETA